MSRLTSRRQGGYVLVLVMGALAMIALLAGRFAARVDDLRTQTLSLSEYAKAQAEANSALQAGLYWITTRPLARGGFGQFPAPELRNDGRNYRLPSGAQLSITDMRGLYPLNAPNREGFARLLLALGARPETVPGLLDVLLDYEDTDNLKRLNGAEDREYQALAMPGPRNDWLLSVSELQRMPLWREQPELIQALMRVASTIRDGVINPNAISKELLIALQPNARPEQIELFFTLRQKAGFDSGSAVLTATGMRLTGDEYFYFASDRQRISVWAPGLPHALQYNLQLAPDGTSAPWLITDVQPETRDKQSDVNATPFPLAIPPN